MNSLNNKEQLINCMSKYLHSLNIKEVYKIKIKKHYSFFIFKLFKKVKQCKKCKESNIKKPICVKNNICFKKYVQNKKIEYLLNLHSEQIFIKLYTK